MAKKFQRKASTEYVTKVYAQLKAEGVPVKNRIGRVAQRIGYTVVGAGRFLKRLGLQPNKY